jgi:hypothetical protein
MGVSGLARAVKNVLGAVGRAFRNVFGGRRSAAS